MSGSCKCGREWEDLPYYEDQVGCPVCDIPPEAEMKIYIFHCWDSMRSQEGILIIYEDEIEGFEDSIKAFKNSQIDLTLEYEQKSDELRELKNALQVIMKHVETEEV